MRFYLLLVALLFSASAYAADPVTSSPVNCAAVSCPTTHPYCIQTTTGATCVNNCTKQCPAGWTCSFGDEFTVNCLTPCATVRCSAGYQCVPQGGYGRCQPIYSCKKLGCVSGTQCKAIRTCNKTFALCEKECGGCACTKEYRQVCGDDGISYANPCLAACGGAEIDYYGPCVTKEPCICPMYYSPVCGADGNIYGNPCQANCAQVKYTACTNTTGPVCGRNGKTYDHYCHAACAGVKVLNEGECVSSCLCNDSPPVFDKFNLYDPVCGVDGVTYSNSCQASCAGVKVAKKGPCTGAAEAL